MGTIRPSRAGQETMSGNATTALADSTDFARVRFAAAGSPIVHETLDGEVVIINLKTGTYYSLQGPGAAVWEALVAGATPPALASRLAEAASIDAAPADFGLRISFGFRASDFELSLPGLSLPAPDPHRALRRPRRRLPHLPFPTPLHRGSRPLAGAHQ